MIKPRRLLKSWSQEGFRLCSTPHHLDDSKQMIVIFVIITWHILCLRHNVCLCNVQQGQQLCTIIWHKLNCARTFPMAPKSEAHETLLLLFTRDGVPPAFICKNAKKMIKLKDAACQLKKRSNILPGEMLQKERLKSLRIGWP